MSKPNESDHLLHNGPPRFGRELVPYFMESGSGELQINEQLELLQGGEAEPFDKDNEFEGGKNIGGIREFKDGYFVYREGNTQKQKPVNPNKFNAQTFGAESYATDIQPKPQKQQRVHQSPQKQHQQPRNHVNTTPQKQRHSTQSQLTTHVQQSTPPPTVASTATATTATMTSLTIDTTSSYSPPPPPPPSTTMPLMLLTPDHLLQAAQASTNEEEEQEEAEERQPQPKQPSPEMIDFSPVDDEHLFRFEIAKTAGVDLTASKKGSTSAAQRSSSHNSRTTNSLTSNRATTITTTTQTTAASPPSTSSSAPAPAPAPALDGPVVSLGPNLTEEELMAQLAIPVASTKKETNKEGERFAGSSFHASPPPSSLPKPKFADKSRKSTNAQKLVQQSTTTTTAAGTTTATTTETEIAPSPKHSYQHQQYSPEHYEVVNAIIAAVHPSYVPHPQPMHHMPPPHPMMHAPHMQGPPPPHPGFYYPPHSYPPPPPLAAYPPPPHPYPSVPPMPQQQQPLPSMPTPAQQQLSPSSSSSGSHNNYDEISGRLRQMLNITQQ